MCKEAMISAILMVACCLFRACNSEVVSTGTFNGCQQYSADILFVLDGSGSVGDHFEDVKTFVKNVSRSYFGQKYLERGIDIGVIQYSHFLGSKGWDKQRYMTTEIKIGEFRSFENFSVAVDKIQLHAYTTYTGHAMEKAAMEFANSSRYNQANHKQIMILITDGRSSDPNHIAPSGQTLRDMGVTVYAVGVGSDVVESELRLIATGNISSHERVYSVATFGGLKNLVDSLPKEFGFINCSVTTTDDSEVTTTAPLCECVTTAGDQSEGHNRQDEDELFLLSLHGLVKALPDAKKFQFRIRVLRLISELQPLKKRLK